MPVSSVGLSLNYGFPGTVSHTPDTVIDVRPVAAASANIPFGAPVYKKSDGTVTAVDGSFTAAAFAGFAAAEVKQMGTYPTTTNGTVNYYAAKQPCDYIERGKVPVKVAHGTPTQNGGVYVRIVANGSFPAESVGDIRADADSTNTILLTNAVFDTGKVDANGVAIVKLKSANT